MTFALYDRPSEDSTLLSACFAIGFADRANSWGHSFGNLSGTLTEVTGDFTEAVRIVVGVLAVRPHLSSHHYDVR